MKRSQLLQHLVKHKCEILREGSRHSIWRNTILGTTTAIPRHTEIKNLITEKICKDLKIPKI